MFIIALEQSQGSKFTSTPLLQLITPQILQKPCSYLQQKAINHFRPYLSPFISANNIEMSTSRETMIRDCPIYFYCDIFPNLQQLEQGTKPEQYLRQKHYVQSIFCKAVPFCQKKQNQRKLKLINSIYIKPLPHHEQSHQKRQKIINRHKIIEDNSNKDKKPQIDKIIPFDQPIYLNGKQIFLLSQQQIRHSSNNAVEVPESHKSWSNWLIDKWDKYSNQNGCIYALY